MVFEDKINVLLKNLPFLPYPLLIHFHDFRDGDIIIFGVEQDIVVQ